MTTTAPDPAPAPAARLWADTGRPVEERVELLLAELTLDEKVAQLSSAWEDVEPAGPEVAPGTNLFGRVGDLKETARHGLGQFTRPYGTVLRPPLEHARLLADRQRQVMAQNRLGLPAMAHDECLTGFTAYGATIYPTSLAMAATFDPALIGRVGAAIGADMAEAGVHQGLAPVLDVIRDYRWGRCEETYGEDPYLVGAMASAYVGGLQTNGVIATLKHFAGYSASMGGRNHAPVHIGRRELFDVILPPFERLVAEGAGSVMNSYADLDGEAPAASRWLLTTLLRDTWGFEGTVVSDYWSIPFLVTAHRVAADTAAAGRAALHAGMDVELPDQHGFGAFLVNAVRAEQGDQDKHRGKDVQSELSGLSALGGLGEQNGLGEQSTLGGLAEQSALSEQSALGEQNGLGEQNALGGLDGLGGHGERDGQGDGGGGHRGPDGGTGDGGHGDRRGGAVGDALDRAVRRVLRQKVELGLCDAGWEAEPAGLRAGRLDLDKPASRALAYAVARDSAVLLANDGTLPLRESGRIALIGPCADDVRTMFGCYSFPNHVLSGRPELGNGVEALSMRASLAAELPGVLWAYAQGCEIRDPGRDGIAEAVATAHRNDVVILMVGDKPGMFGIGTSGEGCDVEDLRLPGAQEELVDAVLATGVPTVLVVVSGRPYAVGRFRDRAAAMVQVFLPGEEGGPAVARLLAGRENFSGKLPVQIPMSPHGQPYTYLHPPLADRQSALSNLDPTPAFGFGHGLSYTSFAFGDLLVDRAEVAADGEFTASVRVRNTGGRPGAEVVQLYYTDPVAQVSRPVRQLLAFAKMSLEAGEETVVRFTVPVERLAFTGLDGVRIVEPGEIQLFAGASSTDTPAEAVFVIVE